MTTAYPVERGARVSNAVAFNGVDDTFGPFGFKIFDSLDVVVEIRDIGEDLWLPTTAVSVTKGAADPDNFTLTFDAVQPDTMEFRVRGARIHERSVSLSKGTSLNMDALAKEHAQIAFTLQELRRDADVINNSDALEAASSAIAAAEEALASLEDVQETQGIVAQLKADTELLKAAAEQAKTDAETARAGVSAEAAAVLGAGRIPVGTMMPWPSGKPPNQYWVLITQPNQAYNRATFPQLHDVLAPEFTVTITNGSAVVTGIGSDDFVSAGMAIEGAGVPAGTTILSVDGASQITLSANATASGTAARVFYHGNGNGSTTSNYPNTAGRVHRGLDTSGTINPDGSGGIETQEDQYEAHKHIGGWSGQYSTPSAFGTTTTENPGNIHAQSNSSTANHAYTSTEGGSETRVKAFIAPFIIKVADGVDDEATLTATQVVQDVADNVADIAAAQANIVTLQGQQLGAGAVLTDVKSTKTINTAYQNTNNSPMFVFFYTVAGGSRLLHMSPDNVTWTTIFNVGVTGTYSLVVPPGYYYKIVNGNQTISSWFELV